jgi:hypothetical protein
LGTQLLARGQHRRNEVGVVNSEAGFGEAQQDGAEDGSGVFLGLEAGVGAELVGRGPRRFSRAELSVSISVGAIGCISLC